MTNININFQKSRHLELKKSKKVDKKYLMFTSIFFGICLVIFIASFSYSYYLNNNLTKITKNKEQLKQSINSSADTEISYLVFSNKLAVIKEIFQNRNKKQEAINYFSSSFGDDIYISQMAFSDELSIDITLTSDNVFSLEKIFGAINSQDENKYQKIDSSNIMRSQDGSYKLSLTVNLDES